MSSADQDPPEATPQTADEVFEIPRPGILEWVLVFTSLLGLPLALPLAVVWWRKPLSLQMAIAFTIYIIGIAGLSQLLACVRPSLRTVGWSAFFSLFMAVSFGVTWLVFLIWSATSGQPLFIWWLILRPIGCAYLLMIAWTMFRLRRRIKAYDDSQILCSTCQYDLRGTLAAGIRRCPECGARVPV